MSEYARAQGYSEQRLRYWREREEATPRLARVAPRLVPGVVVDVGTRGGVRIALPRGVVVEARLATEVPAAWIAEVARALEWSP